jgi:beta-fructofuranosidase
MILSLLPDGEVSVNPAEELKSLRGEHWEQKEIVLSGETEYIVPHAGGQALEIYAEFRPDAGAECGLKVFCSPDGEEQTRIVYKNDSGQIFVEREQASLDQRADVNAATMSVTLVDGEPLQLRVFADHSILEIFVNERLCLACRIYPTRDDSKGIRLFSRKGTTSVAKLNIWQTEAVWPIATGRDN